MACVGDMRQAVLRRWLRSDNLRASARRACPIVFMKHPKVKFKIDTTKDLRTFRAFVNDSKYDGGRSLRWGIFRKHPSVCRFMNDRKRVDAYIRSIYKKRAGDMAEALEFYRKQWKAKENVFFSLTDKLFPGFFWPKGKYIAYLTIWSMFPRFLEDKTFQIPFRYRRKKYVNVIIAHEMLHFIFYEWFYKQYPRYRQPRYNYFVWNVSEIFNVLIQDSYPWIRTFGMKTMPYPEHKKIIRRIGLAWAESRPVGRLVEDIILKVKKEPALRRFS